MQKCYVCGQTRSVESLREGKIIKILDILRWIYILGLSVSYVAIVVALLIKTVGGDFDRIWQLSKYIVERIFHNIYIAFCKNVKIIIFWCSYVPFNRLFAHTKIIWYIVVNNLYLTSVLFTGLSGVAWENIKNSYSQTILLIGKKIYAHIVLFSIVVSRLMYNIYTRIDKLIFTIKELFKTASNHFKQ